MKKPVVLIIMDGMAYGKKDEGDAFHQANTPHLDYMFKEYPHVRLNASGEAVGLPEGQMGNSEVGHMNLGAGRVVYQSLTRINMAIKDGSFKTNDAYRQAFDHVNDNDSKLHIFGLLSDGGVHSHIKHIKALLSAAKANGVGTTYVHAFLDGRDVPPQSAVSYVEDLEAYMDEESYGAIATVHGRYYAMDRDKNFGRTQKAYDAMSFADAEHHDSAAEGIKASYDEGVNDEFVIPFVVDEDGTIDDDDAIIFANFRPDRAIQIGTAYSNPEALGELNTENGPDNILFVSTMKYADSVKGPVAFKNTELSNLYGDYVSDKGLKQLRIAETEKYAHVTFFFDGGTDREIKGATRRLIPSPKVATYDLKPEMSAYEVTDAVLEELDKRVYDTVILNFANGDMVGHTGVIPAAVKAVETVDECVGRVVDKISEQDGVALITADHGNCEQMLDENGEPFTAHTTNQVPFIITRHGVTLRDGGKLGDIAPTMLELLKLDKPEEMTGVSLIDHD